MGWLILKGQLRVQMLMQGTMGPEVDAGSQDMRETWMLLEYADRGNLDRALVQKKMMTADDCLDLVSAPPAAHPTCNAGWLHHHAIMSIQCATNSVGARWPDGLCTSISSVHACT